MLSQILTFSDIEFFKGDLDLNWCTLQNGKYELCVENIPTPVKPAQTPTTATATQKPANTPTTLSPTASSKTFGLCHISPFIMTLSTPNKIQTTRATLREVEDVTARFLLDFFVNSLSVDNSVYITTLKVTDIDQTELQSSIRVRPTTTTTGGRRAQMDNLVFLEVDGIISIRDGILKSVDQFISSTMSEAFQARAGLLKLMKENERLKAVYLAELSQQMEICPNKMRCHHGSRCVEGGGGLFVCDCSAASQHFEAHDGLQCEFAATQFCSEENDVRSYSFCVNGGECVSTNVTSDEPHPGCTCSDSYEGSRCQLMKDLHAERSINLPSDEESTSTNNLSTGDYAIIIIMCIGLILTILIIVYKMKNKSRDQSEVKHHPASSRAVEPDISPVDTMEAGLADKSTVQKLELYPPVKAPGEEKEGIIADQEEVFEVSTQPIPDTSLVDTMEAGLADKLTVQKLEIAPPVKDSEEEKEEIVADPEEAFEVSTPNPVDSSASNCYYEKKRQEHVQFLRKM